MLVASDGEGGAAATDGWPSDDELYPDGDEVFTRFGTWFWLRG